MNRTDRAILFTGALCSIAILSTPSAKAYVDPSVTTSVIQIVVGIAVAVGAVAAIWWRKAKKKVADKLGIEPNQKKETEADLKENDDDDDDD